MKQLLLFSTIALLFLFAGYNAKAQVPTCGASVPYYLVDLRGFPSGSWISPPHIRKGNCCLTSSPDRCTSFKIYVDSATSMINFEIASGAIPSGAMYYQVDCGPMIPVGQPICISGPGPHNLTFCKPGNNTNTYKISAIETGILGTLHACHGATTTLSGLPAGGIWTSTNTVVATISPTGVVAGITPGTTTITYAIGGTCGYSTATVTINPMPTAITGVAKACAGLSSTLYNGLAGGTWSSSNTDTATTGLTSGVVTGVARGKAIITYTTTGGCRATKEFTVHGYPNPLRTDAPTIPEIHDICLGNRISLTADEGPEGYIGWGTQYWTSGNTAVATIDSPGFGGFVTAVGLGVATISFTRGNGCYSTYTFTVHPMPNAITGTNSICNGLSTTLYNTTPGGTWSALPGSAATINMSTGVVTSVYAGIAPIAYTLYYPHQGCRVYDTVTVNPTPLHWIEGTASICVGATTTFTNLSAGGTWTSGNPSVATIDASTGIIAGLSAGTSAITYELYGGCPQTRIVTINPLPLTFSGSAVVCPGSTTTLSNTIPGGTWVTSDISVIHLGWASGVVTGLAAGTSSITYTLPTGCRATTSASVNAVTSISGNGNICHGATTALSAGIGGGTWSSSNPAIASIGSGSCIVNGISSGTAVISYTLPTGCVATKTVTVSTYATSIETSPLYSPALHNICVGNVLQLSAAGAGTWTSSNASIATVTTYTGPGSGMAGQVTALTAGSVVITYRATSTCFSTYTLTVNPTPDTICGPTTVCQYSTCTLSCSSGGGTWFSLDFTHVYVNSTTGCITGAAPGTATVYYRQFGYNGCMVSKCVTVSPAGAKSAGTSNGANDEPTETANNTMQETSQLLTGVGAAHNYTVFPNPGNGHVTFTQRYPTDDAVHIRVIGYSGKIMHEDVLQFRQGTCKMNLDLPPGLYFAELSNYSSEPSTIGIVIKK